MRQVKTPLVLADFIISNAYRYDINFYTTNNVLPVNGAGYYVPTNSPYRTVTIENPDSSTSSNRLFVYEIQDGLTNTSKYTYDGTNTWTLELPGGLRNETVRSTWATNSGIAVRTELKTILDGSSNNVVVYQEHKKYTVFDWGEEMTELAIDPSGANLRTTWEFYTNSAAASFRQLKQKTEPSGYWEKYEYDGKLFVTNILSGFLNATNGVATGSCRQTIISAGNSNRDVTNIVKVLGVEVSRTYNLYESLKNRQLRSQTPGADSTAADNMETITGVFDSSSDYPGAIKTLKLPDGTMSFYDYSIASNQKTTTVYTGETNSGGTGILNGTKTVTVVGMAGETISRNVYDYTNGVQGVLVSSETYTYPAGDYFKLSPIISYLDGTSNVVNHGCCTIDSEVDRDGTYTFYSYDALKRRIATTRNSVTTSNVLDAAGNVLKTVRIGGATLSQAAYDVAGRMTKETNALNGVTSMSHYYDASGQFTKTNTYPDGGLRIETYYMDGQLKSMTGSATHPVRYEYGVAAESGTNRLYQLEMKLNSDGSDSAEYLTNFFDMAGRVYKTVYRDGAYRQSTFNSLGQVSKERDPDNIATLFQYNSKGELEYTAIDTNLNGTIDWTTDRISRTVRDVATINSVDVNRTRTYLWMQDSSAVSNLVAESRVSTDGRRSWDIRFGLTNQSSVNYAGSGARYVTNTAPDGSTSLSYFLNGRLQTVTRKDAGGSQIGQTTYGYDAQGRQSTMTDARTGTTTYGFNNADQVSSVTTPAPGTGEGPQTTSFGFDTLGRLTSTSLPDGGSTTNAYYPSGELKRSSGTRTYPVGYLYDAQGRLTSLTNWTTYPSAGARVTSWVYDHRGFLTNKVYADTNGPVYTYTAAGRLQTRAWARGLSTIYTNNTAGDVVGIGYSDGVTPNVTFKLDRVGRATNIVAGASSTTSLLYNDAGQVLRETVNGLVLTNSYDALLRRTQLALSTNGGSSLFTHAYAYDGASRLTNVSDGTFSGAYSFLANSPLVNTLVLRQNSTTRMTTSKTYDNLNRLLSVSSVGSNTVSAAYKYNDANQRIQNAQPDGSFWVYQYDALGQVTSGKKYWSDWTPVAGQQFEYAFDEIGNRTSTRAGGDSSGAALRSANYSVNSLNQYTSRDVPGAVDILGIANAAATVTVNGQTTYRKGEYFQKALSLSNTSAPVYASVTNLAVLSGTTNTATGNVFLPQTSESFRYDVDGNLTNDGHWVLAWDGENRLVSLTANTNVPTGARLKLEFAYDPRGRRISKTVLSWNGSSYVAQFTNKFAYDGWNLLAELNSANSLACSYLWGTDLSGSLQGAGGVGGLVALNHASNGVHFAAYDGNGNVTALVSGTNGTLSAQYEYGPFGEVVRSSGTMAGSNPFRFSTKFTDNESDFLYYGYRYYNPSAGRWLSRDPVAEQGGPNLYELLGNQPIMVVDPIGLEQFKVVCEKAADLNKRIRSLKSGTGDEFKKVFMGLQFCILNKLCKGACCDTAQGADWLNGTIDTFMTQFTDALDSKYYPNNQQWKSVLSSIDTLLPLSPKTPEDMVFLSMGVPSGGSLLPLISGTAQIDHMEGVIVARQMALTHINQDLALALRRNGVGADNDWKCVGQVVTDCQKNFFTKLELLIGAILPKEKFDIPFIRDQMRERIKDGLGKSSPAP